ncbi:MAG: 3-dehydroquinate synthase, partial [Flavipsychrobacter sp.]
MQYSLSFPTGEVNYVFDSAAKALNKLADTAKCIFITDTNVAALYPGFFKDHKVIIIPAGEENKSWESIKFLTEQLLQHEAHRGTMLIAAGGGMITDITGFIASIYMRGLSVGYIPTTLLCMVDAAIGGKNGINLELHKNILGTIQQPSFILYDTTFLNTLPDKEWSNGFAEVIKYACLFDAELFELLSLHDIRFYKENSVELEKLIATCVSWKNKIVLADEKERGNRKLL